MLHCQLVDANAPTAMLGHQPGVEHASECTAPNVHHGFLTAGAPGTSLDVTGMHVACTVDCAGCQDQA